MFCERSLALLLLASHSIFVLAADPAQQPIQQCPPGAACDQLGCENYAPESYPATTKYEQVVSGPPPWPTPDGATSVGAGVHNGVTTVTFEATGSVTLVVPTSPPQGGGSWTVVEETVTIPNGPGNSLILVNPVLTTVPPVCPPPATTTFTQTIVTTLPPVTTTVERIDYRTSYITFTTVSTTTAFVTLPPSTVTTAVTSTSFVTLPPVTSTSFVSVPPVTSTSTVTLPPFTSTVTSVFTTTVTVSPPSPPPPPPGPQCTPGAVTPWTKINVFKNSPFVFTTNEAFAQTLSFQDAGYKLEQFAVVVDGQQIGVTSIISPDAGVYCGTVLPGRDTCEAKGLSKGQFTIPAGPHTVQIVNIIGVSNDPNAASYTSAFYQLERQCTPGILPPPSCSKGVIQNWATVTVYNGSPYEFKFNYGNPVKLSILDAGYRTEKYTVSIDGAAVGSTDAYSVSENVWCGDSANEYQNCVNNRMSKGEFVVPAGSHTVTVTMQPGVGRPPYNVASSIFYRTENYCPS